MTKKYKEHMAIGRGKSHSAVCVPVTSDTVDFLTDCGRKTWEDPWWRWRFVHSRVTCKNCLRVMQAMDKKSEYQRKG